MKLFVMVLGVVLSFSAVGADHLSKNVYGLVGGKKASQQIAEKFCSYDDKSCVSFLSLELSDAYASGKADRRNKKAWDLNVAAYAKTKRNLCDEAPEKDICYSYRDALLNRYMAGLRSKG